MTAVLETTTAGPRPWAGDPDQDWRSAAACAGVQADAFFSPARVEHRDERVARERAARALCAACPVQQECLRFALSTQEPHGIWGGLNEQERRRLARRERAGSAPAPRVRHTAGGPRGSRALTART